MELEGQVTELATAANITRIYLYDPHQASNGQYTTPERIPDRLRDISPSATTTIEISADDYINSYGIYAVPARSQFVQDFFNGVISLSVGAHSVSELVSIYGIEAFSFHFQHAQVDVGNNNYLERSYVFGHASFTISMNTSFVVHVVR